MTVHQLLPEHLPQVESADSDESRCLASALAELPEPAQQRILTELVLAGHRGTETGDYSTLEHLLSSLSVTVLMHRDADYRRAVAAADAADAAGSPDDEIDLGALAASLRAG